MWIDTYYMDPNQAIVDRSQLLTTNTQVSNLDSEEEIPEMGSQTPDCEDPQDPLMMSFLASAMKELYR